MLFIILISVFDSFTMASAQQKAKSALQILTVLQLIVRSSAVQDPTPLEVLLLLELQEEMANLEGKYRYKICDIQRAFQMHLDLPPA